MKLSKWLALSCLLVGGYAQASCQLYVKTLRFDNYSGNDARGYGGASINCTSAVGPAKLLLSSGDYAGNNYLNRRMKRVNSSNYIRYQLYTNGGLSRVWGNGSQGTDTLSVAGSQEITIYGLIPRNQIIPAGEYSDKVTMTLAY